MAVPVAGVDIVRNQPRVVGRQTGVGFGVVGVDALTVVFLGGPVDVDAGAEGADRTVANADIEVALDVHRNQQVFARQRAGGYGSDAEFGPAAAERGGGRDIGVPRRAVPEAPNSEILKVRFRYARYCQLDLGIADAVVAAVGVDMAVGIGGAGC